MQAKHLSRPNRLRQCAMGHVLERGIAEVNDGEYVALQRRNGRVFQLGGQQRLTSIIVLPSRDCRIVDAYDDVRNPSTIGIVLATWELLLLCCALSPD